MSYSDQRTKFVIVNNVYRGLCNVTIGVISSGEIWSSQMKADTAILIHEIQGRDSCVDQASWYGVESICASNLALSSFRTSPNANIMGLRPLAAWTKLWEFIEPTLSSVTTTMLFMQKPQVFFGSVYISFIPTYSINFKVHFVHKPNSIIVIY